MDYSKKMENVSTFHSLCSGYNYYILTDMRGYEIFGKTKPVIRHLKTGELFYVSEFPEEMNSTVEPDYWAELIQKPANLKHFIWPVDVIIWDTQTKTTGYALVFPMRDTGGYIPFSQALAKDSLLEWNVPWVKKLAMNLLDALCGFDECGYAYHEFSDGNMFYRKDTLDVMFDFSFSTQRPTGLFDAVKVLPCHITPDYADSYYYSEKRDFLLDKASDYCSIAVLLFKMMVGRLPYQGAVMEHEPNITETEHKNWIRLYHKNTFFIFDEKDETNHIGGELGFAKDEMFVERWNRLPENIRNMFHNVFQSVNILRTASELIFYSPKQWKDALFGEAKPVRLNYR